jgi:poly(A) polymerase
MADPSTLHTRALELIARYEPLFGAFAQAGHELVIVGGAVRDLCLGREVDFDVDFATSALPEETIAALDAARIRHFPLGIRFGTIAARYQGRQLEITTYRVEERYEAGSRHPEVAFGRVLHDDLGRRDLSVNAMALRPDGSLYDPFDGQGALASRRLEVPGGGYGRTLTILADDPLRILRIARFAARLDFEPTDDTTRAASERATTLQAISHERWKAELDKLLVAPFAPRGWAWLARTGALHEVLPEADAMARQPLDGWVLGAGALPPEPVPRWAWLLFASRLAEAGVALADATLRGAWPDDATLVAQVHELARRLRWSLEERERVVATLSCPVSLDEAAGLGERGLRRWVASSGQGIDDRLLLLAALGRAAGREPDAVAVASRVAALRASDDPTPVLPPGLGHQVVRRAGIPPGPRLGAAIDALKAAIIDGDVSNRDDIDSYAAWLCAWIARHEAQQG